MEEDPQLDFNFIGKELKTSPSSSSDSGLSSALSLSYEQQLSPLLSNISNEEEQTEISDYPPLNSPHDLVDFESINSPIQSMASVDNSPVRSLMSSNISSPDIIITDDVAEEEMDCEQTLVAVVTPNNTISNSNDVIVTEQAPTTNIRKILGPPIIGLNNFCALILF